MDAPADDLAAQLYVALRGGGAEGAGGAVALLLDAADAAGMCRVSEWTERRPPEDGEPPAKAPYATRGLTALHVLARDCTDAEMVRRGIALAGAGGLKTAGGFSRHNDKKAGGWLPIHLAAWRNSSPEVVRVLLSEGGVEQLQAKTAKGRLPIHLAAQCSSSPEVVRVLLSEGGVEQLQAKTAKGSLPIDLAATINTSADVLQALLCAGSVVEAELCKNALDTHQAALAVPPLSPAEMLPANPPSLRPAVVAFLAQEARQAGLADQAMRPGTRVKVGELGEGVYERFERCRLGCNNHHIRFATGVESVELRKIATELWTVLPEPVPVDPDAPAAGAAALPGVAQSELEPEPAAAAQEEAEPPALDV
jgi:hypothetical protein